ncbi:AraC family transcriptional regulator [Pricia sp.]|uniref:AraC family transcriptional regulator n=1 Tax=Pricia sp. TaxID=2268138 RepID=UPI003593F8A6
MGKKLGLLLGAVLLCSLIWYFFLKPHDYVVRFEIKALPGTINQTLKSWGAKLGDAEFLGQDGISDLKYRIKFNDSTYIYHWKLQAVNDSVSKVKVYVTDDAHSLANRMAIPFSTTDFENRTKKTVEEFAKVLKEHLDSFKASVTGKDTIPAKYCACVALKGTQGDKARGMMEYYSLLTGMMSEKNIDLDGRPMIEVEDWNMQNDSLTYNFCFPVIKSDSLPQRPSIFYKQIAKKPAIRAVYNGNYITSDTAWYALLDYAGKNNIPIDKKPLEIFHANPNMGGDALKWQAEIFMPISD